MPQAEEEKEGFAEPLPVGAVDLSRTRTRSPGVAGHLKAVITRTGLLPAFLVLTVMMLALWLTGMPFLQALTVATGVKIALGLLELRRPGPPHAPTGAAPARVGGPPERP
ncbi:hypothetical protein ACIPW5_00560 [Streptomyces sp. NPDC090077]|uniref:hypothetical protein n=1 Tax=Streptomyces sp. NPDC090077 TaxID=3365938 RepID=UPI00380B869D